MVGLLALTLTSSQDLKQRVQSKSFCRQACQTAALYWCLLRTLAPLVSLAE